MTIKGSITVGAYQFKGSADIEANKNKIISGIKKAVAKNADIVAFHECALCGYPGVEIKSVSDIDKKLLAKAETEIKKVASSHKINVAYGSTVFSKGKTYNSLNFIDSKGKKRSPYFKRAMYGKDAVNFSSGNNSGIINLENIKLGLRVCFDFRFPEYFRQLLMKNVDLAITAFSMVGKNNKKFDTAKAHLISRAAENGIYILSANNLKGKQNCPTCIIDPDGIILAEANTRKEMLITATISKPEKNPVRESIRKIAKSLNS